MRDYKAFIRFVGAVPKQEVHKVVKAFQTYLTITSWPDCEDKLKKLVEVKQAVLTVACNDESKREEVLKYLDDFIKATKEVLEERRKVEK